MSGFIRSWRNQQGSYYECYGREDKPLKYPLMFRSAQLCLINKKDLLPYVDFNVEQAKKNARMVNGSLEFLEVSAKTGEGMERWIEWLLNHHS